MRLTFLTLLLFQTLLQAAPAPKKTEVLIIGAGLSGLATARLLKQKGIDYHLLEISPKVGGRVRTVHYKFPGEAPISADSGMEEYWESNPAVKVLEELGLKTRSDFAISSLKLLGKVYTVGDETLEGYRLRILGKDGVAALQAFDAKVSPLVKDLYHRQVTHQKIGKEELKLKELSFKDYILSQKLPEVVSEWIRVSVECEVGTHWDRFSALDGLVEFHIFSGIGEKSFRVVSGNDKFADTFAKSVGLKNFSLNHRVTRVSHKKDGSHVSYLDLATNTSGVVIAQHVVSTVPLYRLFEVQFDPPLSEKKQEAIQTMTWGSYFKAHLFVPQAASKYWIKNSISGLPILSDTDLGVIYDGNPDQAKGSRIVSLLIFGDTAERFNMAPQGQVVKEIKTTFDTFWPGFSKEISHVEVYRYHPRAIAGWPVGRSRFDDGSNAIREPENRVYLAGDHTESTHSDGAFISADRVVKQILATKSRATK